MGTCHESAYRRSRTGRIDRRSHIRPCGERGPDVAGELVIRVERLLTNDRGSPRMSLHPGTAEIQAVSGLHQGLGLHAAAHCQRNGSNNLAASSREEKDHDR
jgi:hypothetical protein